MIESPCFSCGALVPEVEGPVHGYMDSSPGCWEVFGQVTAREYSDSAYARHHRLSVDAYAVQHPGRPSPQSIQSVATHLVSLHLVFETGMAPHRATGKLQAVSSHKACFTWLEPPRGLGKVTVRQVLDAASAPAHLAAAEAWARSAWLAWKPWHQKVEEWAALIR